MQDSGSISIIKVFFKNKWAKVGLIVIILLIVALVALQIIKNAIISTIIFNVVPYDSTITINGNSEFKNGANSIMPGTYDVTISHQDLESKTISVEVKSHSVINFSTFLYGADHNFKFYELKDNYKHYQDLANIAGSSNNITIDNDTSAVMFIDTFNRSYKLFSTELPIDYYEYKEDLSQTPQYTTTKDISITADTSSDCKKTLCLKVVMQMTDDKSFVENLLKEKGFDLNNFEINYKEPYARK